MISRIGPSGRMNEGKVSVQDFQTCIDKFKDADRRVLVRTGLKNGLEAHHVDEINNPLVCFVEDLYGAKITPFVWEGRVCWLAQDVGRALGYGNAGKDLADEIADAGTDFFKEGDDFIVLNGRALKIFKDAGVVPRDDIRAMLLFRGGFAEASMTTRRPSGIPIRRFVVDGMMQPHLRAACVRKAMELLGCKWTPGLKLTTTPEREK